MQDNDLISRAALGISRCNPDVFNNRAYGEGWNACIAMIEAAPAVDAAPVVHARAVWINPLDPRKKICIWKCSSLCSACGDYVAVGWKYCPNCGAKMDGGEA